MCIRDSAKIRKTLGGTNLDTDNCKPVIAKDLDKETFKERWDDFVVEVKSSSKHGQVLAFVYYTGHGGIPNTDKERNTWIFHKDGEHTNL